MSKNGIRSLVISVVLGLILWALFIKYIAGVIYG